MNLFMILIYKINVLIKLLDHLLNYLFLNYVSLLMILLMLVVLMYLLFMFYISPLMLSLMLILFIFFSVIFMGLSYYSFYYSFIIFMVMVGGFMIIFLYFSGLSDFEKIIINTNIYIWLNVGCMLIMLNILNQFNYIYFFLKSLYKGLNMDLFKLIEIDNNSYIMESYDFIGLCMMMLCILYLILMLICIIKICSFNKFPLRKMMK